MNPKTKKNIENITVLLAPIITLSVFLIPYVALLKEKTVYKGVFEYQEYYSFYNLLKADINVFSKIILWISFLGVLASSILTGLSFLLKEKEENYNKLSVIVLVSSSGLLFLTNLGSLFKKTSIAGAEIYRWIDFMTIPYGLLMIFNITLLIYWIKKENK